MANDGPDSNGAWAVFFDPKLDGEKQELID